MEIKLPDPSYTGAVSLEASLMERRSIRDFRAVPLLLKDLSQLLWAAQGVTVRWGGRTAPSAGGLYPLEVHAVAGDVHGLQSGVYRYQPDRHTLASVAEGDLRAELASAALGQGFIRHAAVNIVFSAVYRRVSGKYGERGVRYAQMEVGHAAQNVLLQAVATNLGAVPIGAFHDGGVKSLLKMGAEEDPLYIVCVGRT